MKLVMIIAILKLKDNLSDLILPKSVSLPCFIVLTLPMAQISFKSYYEDEILLLRKRLEAFSKQFEHRTQSLNLDGGMPSDPDMARLLEGFAWLTASIRQQIDELYPELCHSLIELLFPDFLRPFPSVGIIRYDTSSLKTMQFIPKGIRFNISHKNQQSITFTNNLDSHLPPFHISYVGLGSFTEIKSVTPDKVHALKVTIKHNDPTIPLNALKLDYISLFFSEHAPLANNLLELLLNDLESVVLIWDYGTETLPRSIVTIPLLDLNCRVFEAPLNSDPGFRLLREFFVFPAAFRLFHLAISDVIQEISCNTVDIYFILNRSDTSLERSISKDHLLLGCIPVSNVFSALAEPIRLDFHQRRVPITFGRSTPQVQVYSVRQVLDITNPDRVCEIPAAGRYRFDSKDPTLTWQLIQKQQPEQSDSLLLQVHESVVQEEPRILSVECLCHNGNTASLLPPTADITCIDPVSLPGKMKLIGHTSILHYPRTSTEDLWRVIQELQHPVFRVNDLNPQVIIQELRRFFELFQQSTDGRQIMTSESLESITITRESTPKVIDGYYSIATGCCYHLTLDQSKIIGIPAQLFITVLASWLDYRRPFGDYSRLEIYDI